MQRSPDVRTTEDVRAIDATYRPFPAFGEWLGFKLDSARWRRYTTGLEQYRKTVSSGVLAKAQNIVRRAAAVDTGALEGLYEVDRGFTFTVATEAAFWQARIDEKGEQVRGYIEAQLDAYEYILNLATGETPISEAAVRSLHEIICRNQETFTAVTEIGPQPIKLRKGDYKTSPNHVRDRNGNVHAYAPVDVTSSEMHRLCQELRSDAFLSAHPALQAAYAHYSFVLIHPFADGNGRVARALASVFTYRAQSVPLLILAEKRDEYLDALAEADQGRPQSFVEFVLERTLDSVQLVEESIRAALSQSSRISLRNLQQLNQTRSGYTHMEIDGAATDLIQRFRSVADDKIKENLHGQESIVGGEITQLANTYYKVLPNGYRITKPSRRGHDIGGIAIRLTTLTLPNNVSAERSYGVVVPVDSGLDDDIIIQTAEFQQRVSNVENTPAFEVRISELLPKLSAATQMRIDIFVQGIVDETLAELEQKAREALGKSDV